MKAVFLGLAVFVIGVVSATAEIEITGFGTSGTNPVNLADDLKGSWQGDGSLTANSLDLTNVSNIANASNGIYADLTADGRTPVVIGPNTSQITLTGTLLGPPPGIDKFSISLYDTSGAFNELDYTFAWSSFASGGANGATVVATLTGSNGVFNGTVGSWSLNLFDATGVAPISVSVDFSDLGMVTEYPQITSASSVTAMEGQPFSYQIVATNTPTGYAATGLPIGLNIDAASGIISGVPMQMGVFSVGLGVSNAQGTGTATLALTVVASLPTVSVAATIPKVTAGTGATGVFTLTLSGPVSTDVTVHYAIKGTATNGTDYQFLKGFKKIKAGKSKKNIQVVPRGDLGGASLKTVKLVIQPDPEYRVGSAKSAKVKIYAAP